MSIVIENLYKQGILTIQEVARELQVSVPDAVVLMGQGRALPVIALTEEERATLLRKIREDRIIRNNHPGFNEEDLIRSTIATQRLSGIDARNHNVKKM
jgi:hypothetical protein